MRLTIAEISAYRGSRDLFKSMHHLARHTGNGRRYVYNDQVNVRLNWEQREKETEKAFVRTLVVYGIP